MQVIGGNSELLEMILTLMLSIGQKYEMFSEKNNVSVNLINFVPQIFNYSDD
ncbi:hypothetical protein HMPREF0650_2106 [Hoylesella buccalis ATCC 35310]|uniref:Uncharacterized protein n=1 Tax=Hoylesella buccalis ATCC 35310 TaxID=679190 RepID=D1W429_9BACT|nr:hypothetical protein HMPREF0650_2106 [Hoylesella buccalis ATCC 35310]